ncbi:uncharacterized protein LOC126937100 [Macaca thibetana thibetana]|uniref:uncharacterized protein LOC126937100 n=1 Tax=Macaca thibetana thibetana TaxID=257877 RepID=UPI0021BC36D5|nr:uncharacterized protein LOC126937100 [Macaca thibetana thibetana]
MRCAPGSRARRLRSAPKVAPPPPPSGPPPRVSPHPPPAGPSRRPGSPRRRGVGGRRGKLSRSLELRGAELRDPAPHRLQPRSGPRPGLCPPRRPARAGRSQVTPKVRAPGGGGGACTPRRRSFPTCSHCALPARRGSRGRCPGTAGDGRTCLWSSAVCGHVPTSRAVLL